MRLTNRYFTMHKSLFGTEYMGFDIVDLYNKLKTSEDIEEKQNMSFDEMDAYITAHKQIEKELGVDSITLSKAQDNGFYYKKDNEIKYCRWCVRVGNKLVEVKPCYAVKEITPRSCYYGDVEEAKPLCDAHYWDWKTSLFVEIAGYGKTWALDKQTLEK